MIKRSIICLLMTILMMVAALPAEAAEPGEDGWYWLSSNDRYSKYFAPESVEITNEVATSRGNVPTSITAWTKTGYSYEGAVETLDTYATYGVKSVITDPSKLAYSLALVRINPQNRQLQYAQEVFCDKNGNLLWQKNSPGPIKEMNAQEFDEEFYDAIMDQVFSGGETKRAKAKDRWLTLWETKSPGGDRTLAQEDTTTMRRVGNRVIGWQWITTKDADGNMKNIKFMKVAVNINQGTERVVVLKYWENGYRGFEDLSRNLDGLYHMISPKAPEARGLDVLRKYARTHAAWLSRYSIDE